MDHRGREITAGRAHREGGFTLVEALLGLTLTVIVVVATLAMLDLASRMARAQVAVADMQQSSRNGQGEIVRLLRMAGRGGLPAQLAGDDGASPFALPHGLAVAVDDEVPAGTCIDAPACEHPVLAGTDVLTVRGVLDGPVYCVEPGSFHLDGGGSAPGSGRGELRVRALSGAGALVAQALGPLVEAIETGRPEALLLDGGDGRYQVVELDGARSVVDDPRRPSVVTLGFRTGGGVHADAYRALYGTGEGALAAVAHVGILRELRFYIGTMPPSAADPLATPRPQLLRAEVYPATQSPRPSAASWAVAIAEDVADLQVALAVLPPGSTSEPIEGIDDAGRANDDWLLDSADDDATLPRWRDGRLAYVRVTTTAFASRRDRGYAGPATMVVEDHVDERPDPTDPQRRRDLPDRSFRRCSVRTVVAPRSLQ